MKQVQMVFITLAGQPVPMFSIKSRLYTTLPTAAGTLQTTIQSLSNIRNRAPWKFPKKTRFFDEEAQAILDFLQENKKLYGLQRVGKNTSIISANDFAVYAGNVRTKIAATISHEIIEKAMEHMEQTMIPIEEHAKLVDAFERLSEKVQLLENAQPYYKDIASNAGRMLNAQKGTKAIRNLN